jgi:hypothetical protein
VKALLSFLLLQYTQEIMQKLNTRSTLHPRLFLHDKFTNEEGRRNVALYAAAQDVQLDFGFCPQPVLSLARRRCSYQLIISGLGDGMTVDVI